jgi:hypothetical protein
MGGIGQDTQGLGLLRPLVTGCREAVFGPWPRLLAETHARLHALPPEPVVDALDAVGMGEQLSLARRINRIEGPVEELGLSELRPLVAWLRESEPTLSGRRTSFATVTYSPTRSLLRTAGSRRSSTGRTSHSLRPTSTSASSAPGSSRFRCPDSERCSGNWCNASARPMSAFTRSTLRRSASVRPCASAAPWFRLHCTKWDAGPRLCLRSARWCAAAEHTSGAPRVRLGSELPKSR